MNEDLISQLIHAMQEAIRHIDEAEERLRPIQQAGEGYEAKQIAIARWDLKLAALRLEEFAPPWD